LILTGGWIINSYPLAYIFLANMFETEANSLHKNLVTEHVSIT